MKAEWRGNWGNKEGMVSAEQLKLIFVLRLKNCGRW